MKKGDLVEHNSGEQGYVMNRPYNGLVTVLEIPDVEKLTSGLAKKKYAMIRNINELKVIGSGEVVLMSKLIKSWDNGYTYLT
jgi:hypothetical protein